MTPSRSRLALTLSGAAVAACALVGAPAAHAYTGASAFYPGEQQPYFPQSTTPIESWRLVGTGGYLAIPNDPGSARYGASQVRVSKRFVIGSEHARLGDGGWYIQPRHSGVEVDKTFHSTQRVVVEPDNDSSGDLEVSPGKYEVDLRLSRLAVDLPEPAGGYPKLLKDYVGPDLASVLPGYVLWAGMGNGNRENGEPHIGWTTPSGRNAPGHGRVDLANGDSGSSGFWYQTANARPVIASHIMTSDRDALTFGDTVSYGTRLQPGAGANEKYTTIAAYLEAQFQKYPAAERPDWTTFEQEGVRFNELKPPAPREIRVDAASPTSANIAWAHTTENRVPRTGYVVTVTPATSFGSTFTVSHETPSYEVKGLTAGTQYTVKVVAKNDNGVSPAATKRSGLPNFFDRTKATDAELLEPQSVTYTPHANPTSAVADVVTSAAVASYGSPGNQTLDYCANVSWQIPTAPAGEQLDGLTMSFGGDEIKAATGTTSPAVGRFGQTATTYGVQNGRGSFRICGLTPNKSYGVVLMTNWGFQYGPAVIKSVKTPVGGPLGTKIERARNLRTSTYRRLTADGKADYCVRATWDAPATSTGLPLAYTVKGGIGELSINDPMSLTAREFVKCGLAADAGGILQVWTSHGPLSAGFISAQIATPTGAPAGTLAPRPAGLQLTPRPADNGGKVDYCVDVRWTVTALDGFASGDFVALEAPDGEVFEGNVLASGTTRTAAICGLNPATSYRAAAGVIYYAALTQPYAVEGTVATPAGAAPGTTWAAPTALRVSYETVAGQKCVTLAWNAPMPVAGFPVQRYSAWVVSEGGYAGVANSIAPGTLSKQFCGVPAATALTATVQASYRLGVVAQSELSFTSPV